MVAKTDYLEQLNGVTVGNFLSTRELYGSVQWVECDSGTLILVVSFYYLLQSPRINSKS